MDSLDQWGILFAKADTLGNILNQRVYLDSLGDFMALLPNNSIVRTEDNGYLMTGIFLYRAWGFLLKVDVNGIMEFVKEYPDSMVLTINILAIDSLGNVKWEWESPTINDEVGIGSLHHLDG